MQTQQLHLSSWPPQYTLKKSKRARYIRLKTSMRHGLELVVPQRFNHKDIPEILETNKIWIQKQLARIHSQRKALHASDLPKEIVLPCVQQIWKIFYVKTSNKKLQLLARPHHELVMLGDISKKSACEKLLLAWVKQHARIHLPKVLQNISEETGLTYKGYCIRNQRSRWGSCTYKKVLNLNFKLMMLPAYLVKHIIIHELCHTRQMNHSPKFWRLVASFDSRWEKHSLETRNADELLPLWAVNIF